jgi:hypothetical protein
MIGAGSMIRACTKHFPRAALQRYRSLHRSCFSLTVHGIGTIGRADQLQRLSIAMWQIALPRFRKHHGSTYSRRPIFDAFN